MPKRETVQELRLRSSQTSGRLQVTAVLAAAAGIAPWLATAAEGLLQRLQRRMGLQQKGTACPLVLAQCYMAHGGRITCLGCESVLQAIARRHVTEGKILISPSPSLKAISWPASTASLSLGSPSSWSSLQTAVKEMSHTCTA